MRFTIGAMLVEKVIDHSGDRSKQSQAGRRIMLALLQAYEQRGNKLQ